MPESVMDIYHGIELRTVGGDVRYKFQIFAEEQRATASWMAFYGRIMFVVFTWPDDVELPIPANERPEAAPT
jgi:hypothetical protein